MIISHKVLDSLKPTLVSRPTHFRSDVHGQNSLPPPFNVVLVIFIPLKFLVMFIPKFRHRENAEAFIMILGFELLVFVIGSPLILLALIRRFVVEIMFFIPHAFKHTIKTTVIWIRNRLHARLIDQGGFSPCGAIGAFLLALPTVLVCFTLQLVVVVAMFTLNLAFTMIDIPRGFYRSFRFLLPTCSKYLDACCYDFDTCGCGWNSLAAPIH